jgi:diadenosine tetraphosphate (Ap4A) HIT family hydrolase
VARLRRYSVNIHAQLLADCHVLGRFECCAVLLNKNALVPWFILVPNTALEDVLDLDTGTLALVNAECQQISAFIKQQLGFSKVNFAGLGNVVPQMHLHIIGRSESDACWPQPVWGALTESSDYSEATLAEWAEILGKQYQLAEL